MKSLSDHIDVNCKFPTSWLISGIQTEENSNLGWPIAVISIQKTFTTEEAKVEIKINTKQES
jgi:hypothetical protein